MEKTPLYQNSGWTGQSVKVSGIQGKYCVQEENKHVFWHCETDTRVFVYGESHLQTGKCCQWSEKLFWCIAGAPQTWAKKAATGRTYRRQTIFKVCRKQRENRTLHWNNKRFEPRDVGYLPGATRDHAMGTCVRRELFNGRGPGLKLKKKLQSKDFQEGFSGCEHQGHDSCSALCPAHQRNFG